MNLEPLLPIALVLVADLDGGIVGDRTAAFPRVNGLDFQPERNRFPRLKPEIDDLDLTGAARLRGLLEGLIGSRRAQECARK